MAYNLFVAYDLISPGQNYEAVHSRIKSLGRWYQLQYSFFYVNSALDHRGTHDAIRQVMDANDKLTVVNANAAYITPISEADLAAMNQAWFAQAA